MSEVECKEIALPRKWLQRRYGMEIRFTADEFPEFQTLFREIAEALSTWAEKRSKGCTCVIVNGTIHPWIAGRIREYLRNLRNADSHVFMRGLPVQVKLVDRHGTLIDRYEMSPDRKGEPDSPGSA